MMLSVRAKITTLVEWIFVFAQRYPFAIALFGFVSGVLSFVMVDRNQEFAQLIAIMMLVSWLWLASEVLLKQGIFHWFGFKLPPALVSFATQMVHQESLFFVVPFFFITTAWNSAQMAFTGLLMVAALVSIIDPIYYRWLAQRRWLYFIFHGVTLFAVLLTSLPIIFHTHTQSLSSRLADIDRNDAAQCCERDEDGVVETLFLRLVLNCCCGSIRFINASLGATGDAVAHRGGDYR
jgi:hypothetical protein